MVPHKKSGNEETFLPDFALYNSDISSEVRFELMTIEVKAMKPSDNKYESDLVRLGKQLQVMIDKQALFGVADPMAVEVLVRGVWSKFYKMKLDGKGIYALVELSTFHLMRTPSDITLVPGIIERFMQLKTIAQGCQGNLYDAVRRRLSGSRPEGVTKKIFMISTWIAPAWRGYQGMQTRQQSVKLLVYSNAIGLTGFTIKKF